MSTESRYSDSMLLKAVVDNQRPRRLDYVMATPAVQRVFAALWPTLAGCAVPPTTPTSDVPPDSEPPPRYA